MKKALTHKSTRRQTRLRFALPLWLAGGFTLLGLVSGLGFFASRPAHSVGGPIAVSVANVPLPTTPTDEAAPQQPFEADITCVIQPGSKESFPPDNTHITVPAGKRLIIQTVGLYRENSTGGTLQAYVQPIMGGGTESFALPMVTDNGIPQPGVTQSISLSCDPGRGITMDVFRSGTQGTEVDIVSVYGYLVNV